MTRTATSVPAALLAAVLAVLPAAGCGGTSAKVLERIDGATPPGSTLRFDVFLFRSVSTCAIGNPCTLRDPTQCFYVSDANGLHTAFAPDNTLDFVPTGDARIANAALSSCFRLTMDDAAIASASALTEGLRTRIFQLTGGDVNLDVRLHEVAALDAEFKRFYSGLFLQPNSVGTVALAKVNHETDFVYAITGYKDPDGVAPKMEFCAGTNWLDLGVVGGSTYTWLAMSDGCARPAIFFSAWLVQLYFGLRDIGGLPDLYGGNYPACGNGDPNPALWFPGPDDCTGDPDAPGCGRSSCPDHEAYNAHVLQQHWPHGRAFNGNYCNDGRQDRDETGTDSGGVCDLIGR